MKNKLLSSLTDEKMLLNSFKEFAESKMDHFLNLASVIQDAALEISYGDHEYPTVQDLTARVNDKLESMDLDYNNEILIGRGHATLGDLIMATVVEAESLELTQYANIHPIARVSIHHDPSHGWYSKLRLEYDDSLVSINPSTLIDYLCDVPFGSNEDLSLHYSERGEVILYSTNIWSAVYEYAWSDIHEAWICPFDDMDYTVMEHMELINGFQGLYGDATVIQLLDYSEAIHIPLTDAFGDVIGFIDLETAMDNISSSIHSMGSYAAGAFSMLQDGISDRLIALRDYLSDKFDDAHYDLSGSVSYIKDCLTSSGNVRDLFSLFSSSLSGSASGELLPDDHTEDPLRAEDFTGASPIGPLCFDGLKKGVISTVNVAKTATKTVINGLFSAGKMILSKAKDVITTTVVNPFDLALINGKGDNTIEGLEWKYPFTLDLNYFLNANGANLSQKEQLISKALSDKVIYFDTVFANLAFYVEEGGIDSEGYATISGHYTLSPKSLDLEDDLSYAGPGFPDWYDEDFSYEDIEELIGRISSNPTYLSTNVDEVTLWRSFHRSVLMMSSISSYFYNKIHNQPASNVLFPLDLRADFPSGMVIKNIDFFKVATGYNSDTDSFAGCVDNVSSGGEFYVDFLGFLLMYLDNKLAKILDPSDIRVLPYSTGNSVTRNPSFRVKKDSENRKAFDRFVKRVVLTVVVVTVGILAKRALSRSARKAQLKHAALDREMANKALNGTLTNRDLKILKKAKRKSNLLGKFSQGVKLPGRKSTSGEDDLYGDLILDKIG